MSYFLRQNYNNYLITWDILISDVNDSSIYNPYCKEYEVYKLFKHIITSLILEEEIILLDADLSQTELLSFAGHSDFKRFSKIIDKAKLPHIVDKEDLIKRIKKTTDKWEITLYTSGTTGKPKKITHKYNSLTRFVRESNRNKDDIWGLAYNPSHIAGIQVFFQALLNGNSIVNLFGLSLEEIDKEIKEYKITHLSATPTFYRLLLPNKYTYSSVKSVTLGGEKFSTTLADSLKIIFPNGKIKNIYASTEAGSLFSSSNDIFKIRSEVESFIRIIDNELEIHFSLLGKSELLKESKELWYKTGDIVELVSKNPIEFRFLSRKNEMINVGGSKVNALEVEEVILSIEGIKNAIVYSKSNSVLGSVICCDIVSEDKTLTELKLRTILKSKLQEFKIPRIFRFVEELSITRSGKVKRII